MAWNLSINITETEKNYINNTSKVTFDLLFNWTSTTAATSGPYEIVLDGTTYSGTASTVTTVPSTGTSVLVTVSKVITHNTSGGKTLSYSYSYSPTSLTPITGSGTKELSNTSYNRYNRTSNIIKHKRFTDRPTDGELADGELGYDIESNKLYIGNNAKSYLVNDEVIVSSENLLQHTDESRFSVENFNSYGNITVAPVYDNNTIKFSGTTEFGIYTVPLNTLVASDNVVASFQAKANNTTTYLKRLDLVYMDNEFTVRIQQNIYMDNASSRIMLTETLSSYEIVCQPITQDYSNVGLAITFYNSSTTQINLHNIKLEYATRASSWTPAPADLVTSLQTIDETANYGVALASARGFGTNYYGTGVPSYNSTTQTGHPTNDPRNYDLYFRTIQSSDTDEDALVSGTTTPLTSGVLIYQFDGFEWQLTRLGGATLAYLDAGRITTGTLKTTRLDAGFVERIEEVIAQSQSTTNTVTDNIDGLESSQQCLRFDENYGLRIFGLSQGSQPSLADTFLSIQNNKMRWYVRDANDNFISVAEFNSDALDVDNVEVDNEIGFIDQWSIRPGVATSGKYNLNDVWIGGI